MEKLNSSTSPNTPANQESTTLSKVIHVGPSEELVEYLVEADKSKKPWLLLAGGSSVIAILAAIGVALERSREYLATIMFLCSATLLLVVIHGVRKVVRRTRAEAEDHLASEIQKAKAQSLVTEEKRTEPLRQEYINLLASRAADRNLEAEHIVVSLTMLITNNKRLILKPCFMNRGKSKIIVASCCVDQLVDNSGKSLCGKLPVVPGEIPIPADGKEVEVAGCFEIPHDVPVPLPDELTAHVSFQYTHNRTEFKNWHSPVSARHSPS